jgi:hypothetical protein
MDFSSTFSSFRNFNLYLRNREINKTSFFYIIDGYFIHCGIILKKEFVKRVEKFREDIYHMSVEINDYTPHKDIIKILASLGISSLQSTASSEILKERMFLYALYVIPFLNKYKTYFNLLDKEKHMFSFLSSLTHDANTHKRIIKDEEISQYFNIYLLARLIKGLIIPRSKMVVIPLISLFMFGRMYQTGGGACIQAKIINNIFSFIHPIEALNEFLSLTGKEKEVIKTEPIKLKITQPLRIQPERIRMRKFFEIDIKMKPKKSKRCITKNVINKCIVSNSVLTNCVVKNSSIQGVINSSAISCSDINNSAINNSSMNNCAINASSMNDSVINASSMNDSVINASSMNNSVINGCMIDSSVINNSMIDDLLIDEFNWEEDLLSKSFSINGNDLEDIDFLTIL